METSTRCTTQSSSSAISICSLEYPTNPFFIDSPHVHKTIPEDHHHDGLMKNDECDVLDVTDSTVTLENTNVISLGPFHPIVPRSLDSQEETWFPMQNSEDLDAPLFANAVANDGQNTSCLDTCRGEGMPHTLIDELAQTQEEVSEMLYQESYYEILKDANLDEVLVDTAAPFESVKEAASKFGGVADWKAQRSKTIEKRRHLQSELERITEEIPKYKSQSEDAEALKIEVLTELDHTKRLVEELKLSLEKAETQEAQARQDSELAELRAKEMAQGISNDVSIAAKAQLDVAKERHENAVLELRAVRREVEAMQREYVSLAHESDEVVRKAKDSVSTSKEIERNVEVLTLELITMKEMLDCAHSVRLEVEEHRIGAVLSLEQDKRNWERELKTAEAQLFMLNERIQTTDDVKFKLDTTCVLLAGLKVELVSLKEARSKQQEDGIIMERELQDVRANIKRSKEEINCLRIAACSLMHELDKEQKSLTTLSRDEELVSTSVSMSPLEQIMTTTGQEQVEHEVRKAREEAEQTKAAVRTLEARLNVVIQEIETSKASLKMMDSVTNSGGEDSTARITLQNQEYYNLCETAREATERANKRVLAAIEQIKTAKASELKTSLALREAVKELEGRRTTLKAAIDNAERTKDAKTKLENELRLFRTEHELQRNDSSGGTTHSDDEYFDEDGTTTDEQKSTDDEHFDTDGNTDEQKTTDNEHFDADGTADEQKTTQMARTQTKTSTTPRKRLFLPRLLMFLARKKAQSLK